MKVNGKIDFLLKCHAFSSCSRATAQQGLSSHLSTLGVRCSHELHHLQRRNETCSFILTLKQYRLNYEQNLLAFNMNTLLVLCQDVWPSPSPAIAPPSSCPRGGASRTPPGRDTPQPGWCHPCWDSGEKRPTSSRPQPFTSTLTKRQKGTQNKPLLSLLSTI